MIRIRRSVIVMGFGIVALALVGLFTEPTAGQPNPKGQPFKEGGGGSGNAAGLSSVKIIEDSQWRRVIRVGEDCIKDKDWPQAIEALQKVLALETDFYVQVTEQDVNNPQKD